MGKSCTTTGLSRCHLLKKAKDLSVQRRRSQGRTASPNAVVQTNDELRKRLECSDVGYGEALQQGAVRLQCWTCLNKFKVSDYSDSAPEYKNSFSCLKILQTRSRRLSSEIHRDSLSRNFLQGTERKVSLVPWDARDFRTFRFGSLWVPGLVVGFEGAGIVTGTEKGSQL